MDNLCVLCTCSVTYLYPTLCDPMDCRLPGSSVCEIFQARILKWVAISSSRGIFPTQGSNPRLLHWQEESLPGKPSVCVKWINMRYQYTQHSNIQKNSSKLLLFPSCYRTIPFVKAAAKVFTTTARRFLQAEMPKEVKHSFLSFWISK